eukprot:7029988-Alexandrium_andersonii.AAC.1
MCAQMHAQARVAGMRGCCHAKMRTDTVAVHTRSSVAAWGVAPACLEPHCAHGSGIVGYSKNTCTLESRIQPP